MGTEELIWKYLWITFYRLSILILNTPYKYTIRVIVTPSLEYIIYIKKKKVLSNINKIVGQKCLHYTKNKMHYRSQTLEISSMLMVILITISIELILTTHQKNSSLIF